MPKRGSKAFTRMSPTDVSAYQEYMKRVRSRAPQDEKTRAGNNSYSKAMRSVREDEARLSQVEQ